ncbi:hypothetical protein B1T48_01795 [Mycobacterium persicum]|nr:hypothetical protein B1T48_01795 [Mycobacterium persicum]
MIGDPGCSAVTGPDVNVGALIDGGGGANEAEDLTLDDVVPDDLSLAFDAHPVAPRARAAVRIIGAAAYKVLPRRVICGICMWAQRVGPGVGVGVGVGLVDPSGHCI